MSFMEFTSSLRSAPRPDAPAVMFKWYRHPVYDMAMGVHADPNIVSIGEYCLKLHPLDPRNPDAFGAGEYFCDPDSVVSMVTPGSDKLERIVYLPYLRWRRDISVNDQSVTLMFRHHPDDGHHPVVPKLSLPLEIKESHAMRADTELVISDVSLVNHYDQPVDILYCYQDAAYLWFPLSNQSLVQPWVEADGFSIHGKFYSQKIDAFGHTSQYDKRHGVIAG
ncbi:MAG: hypothetical protein LBJ14_03180, partial [Desulfarculales bacterium]|nr:hypothetical protein [Desulfarculales bacterium]